jgi:hypothetical protein
MADDFDKLNPRIWPMGAKVPLMVAQANEANDATDEMPAKAGLLYAPRLAFVLLCLNHFQGGDRDSSSLGGPFIASTA